MRRKVEHGILKVLHGDDGGGEQVLVYAWLLVGCSIHLHGCAVRSTSEHGRRSTVVLSHQSSELTV